MKKVLVVIPTYNERQNIKPLLASLFAYAKGYKLAVLVVDDNSPDGTANLVRSFQLSNKNVYLIEGTKKGLGAAYKRAFAHALKELDFDILVTMDADFSHNPADVSRLVSAVKLGADVAVGSRYAPGGMIPGNWPLRRILNTKTAHFVTRFVGGVNTETQELTGGFKAITRARLKKIPFQRARVSGFGFQIFLTNEFVNQKMTIVEVPISFADRKAGQSKLGAKDIAEFFLVAWRLNSTSPFKRFLGFSAISLLTLVTLIAGFSLVDSSERINILLTSASLWLFGALQLGLIGFSKTLRPYTKYIKAYLLALPMVQIALAFDSLLPAVLVILVGVLTASIYFAGLIGTKGRWQTK